MGYPQMGAPMGYPQQPMPGMAPGYYPPPGQPMMPQGMPGMVPHGMPGMMPQGVPGMMPGYGAPQMMPGMQQVQRGPHTVINPACPKCRGTLFNSYKHKPCGKCVCKKCGGSGYNYHKNKPCKKMKFKLKKRHY